MWPIEEFLYFKSKVYHNGWETQNEEQEDEEYCKKFRFSNRPKKFDTCNNHC